MPASAKPPRLWKRPARRDKAGRVTHAAAWVILDRGCQFSTGCNADDIEGAQRALADYINKRHERAATGQPRRLEDIPIADVLNLYAKDVAAHCSNPKAAAFRLERLAKFFHGKKLADLNGPLCREYADQQNTDTGARRDLQDLSAAINHHLAEGLHSTAPA